MTAPKPTPRFILGVDDDPAISKLLRTVLEAQGYEVGFADDGQSALDKVALRHPDLVILDIDMADVDGFEVCRQLKTARPAPHSPPSNSVRLAAPR